jgi:hypothetical protein
MSSKAKLFLTESVSEFLHYKSSASRMYENKEKQRYRVNWWFKFIYEVLNPAEFIVIAGALDYVNRNFRMLKVPPLYLLQNIDKIDMTKDGWINLHVNMRDLIILRTCFCPGNLQA